MTPRPPLRSRRASGTFVAAMTVAHAPSHPVCRPGAQAPCPASARLPGSQPHCSDMLGRRAPHQPRPETGRALGSCASGCRGLSRTLGHDPDFRVPCALSGSQVEDVM